MNLSLYNRTVSPSSPTWNSWYFSLRNLFVVVLIFQTIFLYWGKFFTLTHFPVYSSCESFFPKNSAWIFHTFFPSFGIKGKWTSGLRRLNKVTSLMTNHTRSIVWGKVNVCSIVNEVLWTGEEGFVDVVEDIYFFK